MIGTSTSSPRRFSSVIVLAVCLVFVVTPNVAAGVIGGSSSVTETESQITVTSASLDQASIAVGDTAVVRVTVTNSGEAAGSAQLQLTGDGIAYVQTLVRLDAGETRTIAFRYVFDSVGDYELAVNGVSAGELTVAHTESTETEETSTPTTDPKNRVSLGAWVLAVVVFTALGAGLVHLSRRR